MMSASDMVKGLSNFATGPTELNNFYNGNTELNNNILSPTHASSVPNFTGVNSPVNNMVPEMNQMPVLSPTANPVIASPAAPVNQMVTTPVNPMAMNQVSTPVNQVQPNMSGILNFV